MKNVIKAEGLSWKNHWFILGLALHILVAAYNHTLSAFVNYTPPFFCQDPGYEGQEGCVYGNTSDIVAKDACVSGYAFHTLRNDTSIVTEWSLICDDRLYQPMATTLYFVGVTIGALVLGILADKLGRKPLVIVCLYAHAALGVIISLLAYSYTLYVVLRAVQGFFVQGLQSCTYTLALELIPTQHRTAMGVVAELYWSAGLMLLSLASYYIPQWRTLQLVLSVLPAVVSIIYILYVPESKIWLTNVCKNKNENVKENFERRRKTSTLDKRNEGRQTFEIIDRDEKIDENEDTSSLESTSGEKDGEKSSEMKAVEGQAMVGKSEKDDKRLQLPAQDQENLEEAVLIGRDKYVLEILWLSKGLRRYNIVMVVSWFSTMIAYYTITFQIPNLSGNRHFNFFLGALVELAAYLITYVVLSSLGRRLPLSFYQLLGGVICCAVAFIPKDSWAGGTLTTIISLLGKGAVVSSYCCLNLYTSELFPTTVRAAALGHCAFWGRIGSLLAPQLIVLGDYTSRSLPLIIVGVIGLFTCFIVLALPETLGRSLPNNLNDIDNINRVQERKSKLSFKKPKTFHKTHNTSHS